MNGKPMPIARYLCFLGFLACLTGSCGETPGGLRYGDYHSGEDWRTALLQQVPVGSSMSDVISFLKRKGVPKRSRCGYFETQKNPPVVILDICECKLCEPRWWTQFQFDENGQLKDISVDLYP